MTSTVLRESRLSVTHNVPGTLSSFIGRAAELEAVRDRLGDQRLLTLVGAGGAGKTRLSREVAAAEVVGTRFDAIWWVELAPVRASADVVAAIAAVLGVGGAPGRTLLDAVSTSLQRQPTLLVLDNCEHVADDVAQLVAQLLRSCPMLHVLATSREPLAIDGEFAWSIPALSMPAGLSEAAPKGAAPLRAQHIAGFDAVRLFVERVRAVTPNFALSDGNAEAVAVLCQRLDGMPLALELAAAVVPVLGVDELVARFDDALSLLSRGRRSADPRHRTLRAVLDWSYELLTAPEQQLLRRLSVFRGPFTLDAVEAVGVDGGNPRERGDVVMALGRLVEHSLVEVRDDGSQSRYRLLETVRQYGAMLLRDTPDEAVVRARHARYVTRFAAEREGALFTSGRGRTVAQLRRISDEIRAAVDWCLGPGENVPLALKLGGVLGWYWISGVPWSEARTTVHRILDAHDARALPYERMPVDERLDLFRLLYPVIGLAYFAGDVETMLSASGRDTALLASFDADVLSAEQRVSLLRQASLSQQLRGIALGLLGQAETGLAHMDRSIALAAEIPDPWLEPVMRIRRALVHFLVGDLAAADRDYSEAIPALTAIGEHWFLSLALEGQANVLVAEQQPERALGFARDAALVLTEERDEWFVSRACDTTAWVILNSSEGALATEEAALLAARLLGAADTLRRSCGAGIIGPDVQREQQMRERLALRLAPEVCAACFAEGAAWTLEQVFDVMRSQVPDLTVSDTDGVTAPAPYAAPPSAVALRVRLLGRLALEQGGSSVPDAQLPSGKVRELLAYLALNDGATKDEIGLALWPEASAAQLRNVFHVTMHHLRRHLGEQGWVAFERGRYRLLRELDGGARCEIDVDVLTGTARAIRQSLQRRAAVAAEQLDTWEALLLDCEGEFLAGVSAEEWLTAAQDRLRAVWSGAMDDLLQLARLAQRPQQVLALCEQLVRRDPYRESAHRAYMEALGALGETARALAHYESLVVMLKRELGAQPSADTRRVVDALRR